MHTHTWIMNVLKRSATAHTRTQSGTWSLTHAHSLFATLLQQSSRKCVAGLSEWADYSRIFTFKLTAFPWFCLPCMRFNLTLSLHLYIHFITWFCNPYFFTNVILVATLSLPTWRSSRLISCFLLCMSNPSCFLFTWQGWEFLWLDVAHGRNTLFQPVPFPLHHAPRLARRGSKETRITVCFLWGYLP